MVKKYQHRYRYKYRYSVESICMLIMYSFYPGADRLCIRSFLVCGAYALQGCSGAPLAGWLEMDSMLWPLIRGSLVFQDIETTFPFAGLAARFGLCWVVRTNVFMSELGGK